MMKDIDLNCDAEIALSVFKDVEFEHRYEKNLLGTLSGHLLVFMHFKMFVSFFLCCGKILL